MLALCAAVPVFGQDPRPVLAAITGEGVCTATTKEQPSRKANVKLLQAGAGHRILEVETERFKARGPAAQVESKKTGNVAYFLDYGSLGSIAITFRVAQGGDVRAKLIITREKTLAELEGEDTEDTEDASETIRYEYDCKKKP